MDLGSIFLILAVFIGVALYVARPFFERRGKSLTKADHDLSHLLAERDQVLTALQELEFDHILGKIPEEDYPAQRNALLVKGAETLRQLDAYQPPSSQQTAEDRLEAAVAARRIVAASASAGAPRADDQLEVIIAERRRAREGKSAGFCHKCGSPLQISDRFCPRCGATAA
jgi:hypothetical protein